MTADTSFRPTPSQRDAIRAPDGPVLVLAGPGAGKTGCLIARIEYLIGERGIDPTRICALTFTNKAAEEVAQRLTAQLGQRAEGVTRCTIHSLCVKILRAHGSHLGLERGFGIADEEYQRDVLGKCAVPAKWRGNMLGRFTLYRLANQPLHPDDEKVFRRYQAYLAKRRVLDFDDLLQTTARLFADRPEVGRTVAGQWEHLLVDECQDLNPVQYQVIRTLGAVHGNVFAVGDDEQSIFSWTGADPRGLKGFQTDFGEARQVVLGENHRTARHIFGVARKLIAANEALFGAKEIAAQRESSHPVEAKSFADDDAERAWLLDDLLRDQSAAGLSWGRYGVLYRKHAVGDAIEGALLQAGVPCRLAHGRSLADDPVIRYLLAALRVIAYSGDPIINEAFARLVLPAAVIEQVRRLSQGSELGFMPTLRKHARELPYTDEDGKKIRRALYAMNNLPALGKRHERLDSLVDEILSQRVGPYRTPLELHVDDLTDPREDATAVRLAQELNRVKLSKGRILIERSNGLEIGLTGLLVGAGFRLTDYLGVGPRPVESDLVLGLEWRGELGLAMTTFKALQIAVTEAQAAFRDFVVVDLETTDKDIATAEIVEIAAARVRNWEIVEEFHQLVKPRVPIAPQAQATHGYSEADLAEAPHFEEVWPRFREFVGRDQLIAHNGYEFDFPILTRMSGHRDFVVFDTLPLARWLRVGSAKLELLAERFKIDPGDPHKALWDVRTLAKVFRELETLRLGRARRVALSNVLDHLGIALALSDPESLNAEGKLLREVSASYSLGRYTNCLDFYQAERGRAGPSAVDLDELVRRLGGEKRRQRIQEERKARDRYPQAMARVQRLLTGLTEDGLDGQIAEFLGRVALSKSDGVEADPNRVNLLTLHSTKGLQFSRVYIVGVEDSEMPGVPSGRAPSQAELEESRRLLYVGMTRAEDRLVMTRSEVRAGRQTGGQQFFDEMGLVPER